MRKKRNSRRPQRKRAEQSSPVWMLNRRNLDLRKLIQPLVIVLVCSSLIFLASWLSLFELVRIDTWLERKFITYANAFTYQGLDQNVVLITAVEDEHGNGSLGKPDQSWRAYHAQLLNALAEAKAKVVAFDLFFEDSSGSDEAFGKAIKSATEGGTTVVVGVRKFYVQEGVPTPSLTPMVQNYLQERNWGCIDAGGVDKDTNSVRKVKLAIEMDSDLPAWAEAQEPRVVPTFALQVMRAGLKLQSGTTTYNKNSSQIKVTNGADRIVRTIPVDDGTNFIIDEKETAELEKIDHPYQEVLNNLNNRDYLRNFFTDKIIIVGYKTHEDLRSIGSGENRYGLQIQANAVSDLLQEVYLRRLPPVSSLLIIGAMSTIGLFIGTRYRHLMRYKIPIQVKVVDIQIDLSVLPFLVTAGYLILAVVFYKYQRILLGIPYHVVVLFLTFWLADQLESRRKSTRT